VLFSFSFSPVRAEGGEVGGVFTAVIETTERVVGARRLSTLRELSEEIADASTVEQVCERAAGTLARNPADTPFALFYVVEPQGDRAHLAGTSGITRGHAACPAVVDVGGTGRDTEWSLARVAAGQRAEIATIGERFGGTPLGAGPDPATTAMLLPIARTGQVHADAILIAGVSARRALDDSYRGFYEMVATTITTAIANARAYEEERARADALAEIDRVKTAFFSNVSHEFRTPLTLLLGPLDEMLRSPLPPARAREELRMVHRNGLRLLKLVNTLLDFSRIEAGRVEAVFEPTDLAALTAELASGFRSAFECAGLSLRVECPPLPAPVSVDREMWEKIVLTLLSNAFKFTFQGEIVVSVRALGTGVELLVRDTGVGIPQHDLPHVFERFHRVKGGRARTHEGTGIGLALVQELVKILGGTVRADSRVDHGTTVTVSIAGDTGHAAAQRDGRRTMASTATGRTPFVEEALRWLPDSGVAHDDVPPLDFGSTDAETDRRARILCADDNADMRDYLRRLLGRRYDVDAWRTVTKPCARFGAAGRIWWSATS